MNCICNAQLQSRLRVLAAQLLRNDTRVLRVQRLTCHMGQPMPPAAFSAQMVAHGCRWPRLRRRASVNMLNAARKCQG